MSRIVYVNGMWCDDDKAYISVFDRGFLFADAIYEVTSVIGGRLIEYAAHMARLHHSLRELDIVCPLDEQTLLDIHREIVQRNKLDEGLVYVQISRGVADRDFAYPANVKPTLIMFSQEKSILENPDVHRGISVVTVPDMRWQRRDIKTVQLLYSSMAKMEAKKQGADDVWLVENGVITEGSSNTAYIIKKGGILVTRELSQALLPGVTRRSVLDIARDAGIKVIERCFTLNEAKEAQEAFISSATNFVLPVVKIDGHPIADGRVGEMTKKLRKLYIENRVATAI